MLRRRRPTPAELRQDVLRQARLDAPTLREFLPAAARIWVALTFDTSVLYGAEPLLAIAGVRPSVR